MSCNFLPAKHVVSISPSPCLLLTFTCPFSLVLSSLTKFRDTLIKISSNRLRMIFAAFYPPRIDDGCGFWEHEINISSRLRQIYMHGRRPRKLESNLLTYDERGWRGAEKDIISLLQCVCLLSSIKLRLTVETVNYVIIAGREVTPANCVSLYGFPKIACRKFIDFLPAAGEVDGASHGGI